MELLILQQVRRIGCEAKKRKVSPNCDDGWSIAGDSDRFVVKLLHQQRVAPLELVIRRQRLEGSLRRDNLLRHFAGGPSAPHTNAVVTVVSSPLPRILCPADRDCRDRGQHISRIGSRLLVAVRSSCILIVLNDANDQSFGGDGLDERVPRSVNEEGGCLVPKEPLPRL